jgi:hypothetical protein
MISGIVTPGTGSARTPCELVSSSPTRRTRSLKKVLAYVSTRSIEYFFSILRIHQMPSFAESFDLARVLRKTHRSSGEEADSLRGRSRVVR